MLNKERQPGEEHEVLGELMSLKLDSRASRRETAIKARLAGKAPRMPGITVDYYDKDHEMNFTQALDYIKQAEFKRQQMIEEKIRQIRKTKYNKKDSKLRESRRKRKKKKARKTARARATAARATAARKVSQTKRTKSPSSRRTNPHKRRRIEPKSNNSSNSNTD